jgi:hypothetical protein
LFLWQPYFVFARIQLELDEIRCKIYKKKINKQTNKQTNIGVGFIKISSAKSRQSESI